MQATALCVIGGCRALGRHLAGERTLPLRPQTLKTSRKGGGWPRPGPCKGDWLWPRPPEETTGYGGSARRNALKGQPEEAVPIRVA
ncbi:hypothetical protein GW17_00058049 [Ensete ventricosum]|nr:hypothetical protein GW17_00058049 [Ensete ventricosum]RZS06111.1 hypothetical protein BHM03_00036716 [Ensete ventricosum]